MTSFKDRSISKFKARLTGGGARANLFEVKLGWPPELKAGFNNGTLPNTGELSDEGTFMVKAAELPASNVGDIPVNFRGRILHVAGDRTFDPWTITIINNTDWNLRQAFEKWSDAMNDRVLDSGVTNPTDYHGDMEVSQLARGKEAGDSKPASIPYVAKYKMFGCWPSQVSSIALDYGSTDTIEEFQVTFQVEYWSVDYQTGPEKFNGPTSRAAPTAS